LDKWETGLVNEEISALIDEDPRDTSISPRRLEMKFTRRTIDHLKAEEATIISAGTQLSGAIKGTSNVILHGALEGNIQLSATVVLGKTGKVRGEINATNVVVGGDVDGIIRATEKVEIRDGGRCKGDIFTATIAISEKAYFDGNVKMEVKGKEPNVLNFTEKRRPQSENEGVLPR
jgi:cytoskeletal protein CcmA (bactofilin family)